MARAYKKTCRTCNLFQTNGCYRNCVYEHDGYDACESYKRKGGRGIKKSAAEVATYLIVVKCAEEGCKYFDINLKSGCTRGDDPENCQHYEFLPTELRNPEKRAEKNLSGVPNMKLKKGKSDPEKCLKKDCLYFSMSSRTKDNCADGGFKNKDKCNYIPRSHTKLRDETQGQTLAAGGSVSPKDESFTPPELPRTKKVIEEAMGIRAIDLLEVHQSGKLSNVLETICKIAKEYDVEIIIRPVAK